MVTIQVQQLADLPIIGKHVIKSFEASLEGNPTIAGRGSTPEHAIGALITQNEDLFSPVISVKRPPQKQG